MKLLLPRPQIIFPYSWDFILFLWSAGSLRDKKRDASTTKIPKVKFILRFRAVSKIWKYFKTFWTIKLFQLFANRSIRITNLPSYHTQIKNKNNILGVNPHSCGALQVNMTSLLKKNLTYHIEGLCMVHIVITYSYHGKGNIESSSIGSLGSRKITPWRTWET